MSSSSTDFTLCVGKSDANAIIKIVVECIKIRTTERVYAIVTACACLEGERREMNYCQRVVTPKELLGKTVSRVIDCSRLGSQSVNSMQAI